MPVQFSELSKLRQEEIRRISCNRRREMLFFAKPNGRAGWKLVAITISGGSIFLLVKVLQWLAEGYRIVAWTN